MKLAITAYDITVTVKTPYDDMPLDEIKAALRTLLFGIRYSERTINELFNEPAEE